MTANVDDYEIRVEIHYDEPTEPVREFPLLSWIEDTPEKAVNGMREMLREILEDMEAKGEDIPTPLPLTRN